MLLSLHIENIAVIKSIDVDFSRGFTALTGETGAGKSIIIESINLLFGAKWDKELLRSHADFALISGCFGELTERTLGFLSELGIYPDEEGNLLIQRTVTRDGRSQIKINGRTVTLSVLKEAAPFLMSIHGQSDTASLTAVSNHIELLDVYAAHRALLDEYDTVYSELLSVRRKIDDLTAKAAESVRLREMLEYQIRDIDAVALHDGEEEELVEKKVKIRNSEKISKHSDFVYRALVGAEKVNVAHLLDKSAGSLSQLSAYIPECSELSDKLRELVYQVEDVAERVSELTEYSDENPTESLNMIESRLDKISKLKRKYGLTVADILAYREQAAQELDSLDNSEVLLKSLSEKEGELYKKALVIADELHMGRVKYAKQLEASVKETLDFLDMPKVVFFASIKEEFSGERKLLNKFGSDTVEFYISANRGAEPQPLSRVASGGELARIMLALKSTIADKGGAEALVFDEIDAGVSGKTARKIGIKMRELSQGVQLFCITHSAQIASLADEHLLISKQDVDGVTESRVTPLDREGRINELSRILGGINVTEAQRAAAIDMLEGR